MPAGRFDGGWKSDQRVVLTVAGPGDCAASGHLKQSSSMTANPPKVVILSGPNGSGKTTCAPRLLRGLMKVSEFVNADSIAQGLSAFAPETVAIAAGRLILTRLQELAGL